MKFTAKNTIKVLAIVSAMSIAGAAMAKNSTTKPSGLKGKVESVEGMVITVKNKGVEVTIQTDANTVFTLDGKPATLADVKAGEHVVSASPSTGIATEVKLSTSSNRPSKKPTTTPSAAN